MAVMTSMTRKLPLLCAGFAHYSSRKLRRHARMVGINFEPGSGIVLLACLCVSITLPVASESESSQHRDLKRFVWCARMKT